MGMADGLDQGEFQRLDFVGFDGESHRVGVIVSVLFLNFHEIAEFGVPYILGKRKRDVTCGAMAFDEAQNERSAVLRLLESF